MYEMPPFSVFEGRSGFWGWGAFFVLVVLDDDILSLALVIEGQ